MDPKQDIFYKLLLKVLAVYRALGVILIVTAFVILGLNLSPDFLYGLDPGATPAETNLLVHTVQAQGNNSKSTTTIGQLSIAKALPPVDPSLPSVNTLQIPKIGVDGPIHEGANGDAQLEKGLWRDPTLGDPISGLPMVLAAHRFGYTYWSQDFRTKDSFYNLPSVSVGDEIIVIWGQRQFKYRVVQTFDTTELSNINADLVLYTCRFFRNDTRIVVYANLE